MGQYKVRITREDGTGSEIRTEPETFEVHTRDGALGVCVGWNQDDLAPREYVTVSDVWPGRETLELTDDNSYEVIFTGTVQAIGHDKKIVFLSAHEETGS